MVGIGEIGVISFANRAQALLVDYLRGLTVMHWHVPIGVVTFGRVSAADSALRMLAMEQQQHGSRGLVA